MSMSHLQAADSRAADTVEGAPCTPTPNLDSHLTVGRHFKRFAKATLDWKTVVSPAATAEISQISPWHAGFANNSTGYLQHYRDNVIGNVSGKLWGTFLLPFLFKQNEKFKATEPGASLSDRLVHVLTHAIFTASSAGNRSTVFNVGAVPATALNALLSDAYLPRQQRTVSSTFLGFGLGMAVFVAGDTYTEFHSMFQKGAVTAATMGMVKQPPPAVDYSQLTSAQQDLLKTAGKQWTGLSVSQQVEYDAVTHALDNWCTHDKPCSQQTDHAASSQSQSDCTLSRIQVIAKRPVLTNSRDSEGRLCSHGHNNYEPQKRAAKKLDRITHSVLTIKVSLWARPSGA
jgi:hypothetical protein